MNEKVKMTTEDYVNELSMILPSEQYQISIRIDPIKTEDVDLSKLCYIDIEKVRSWKCEKPQEPFGVFRNGDGKSYYIYNGNVTKKTKMEKRNEINPIDIIALILSIVALMVAILS